MSYNFVKKKKHWQEKTDFSTSPEFRYLFRKDSGIPYFFLFKIILFPDWFQEEERILSRRRGLQEDWSVSRM